MGRQIRQLTGQANFAALPSGHVELDAAYAGGRRSDGKREYARLSDWRESPRE